MKSPACLAFALLWVWVEACWTNECAARATLGIRQAGGMVFTASTVDWARVLAAVLGVGGRGEAHRRRFNRTRAELSAEKG